MHGDRLIHVDCYNWLIYACLPDIMIKNIFIFQLVLQYFASLFANSSMFCMGGVGMHLDHIVDINRHHHHHQYHHDCVFKAPLLQTRSDQVNKETVSMPAKGKQGPHLTWKSPAAGNQTSKGQSLSWDVLCYGFVMMIFMLSLDTFIHKRIGTGDSNSQCLNSFVNIINVLLEQLKPTIYEFWSQYTLSSSLGA